MQHNGSRVIMKYTDVYGIIRFIHARAVASNRTIGNYQSGLNSVREYHEDRNLDLAQSRDS